MENRSRFPALFSLLLIIIALQVFAKEPTEIRLMPLGDSITAGCCEGENGYRKKLYQELVNNGYQVSFVGSMGPKGDEDFIKTLNAWHEGHFSYTVENLLNCLIGEKEVNVNDNICKVGNKLTVREHEPNIILYHIGTNDLSPEKWTSSSSVEFIAEDVKKTLNYIYNIDPSITVLLAKIILTQKINKEGNEINKERNDRTKSYNLRLEQLVREYTNRGHSIISVNMQDSLNYYEDTKECPPIEEEADSNAHLCDDGIHPTDKGMIEMAKVWFEELNGRVLIRPTAKEPDLLEQAKTENGVLIDGILDHLYGLDKLRRISDGADQVWLNHGEGAVTAKATFTEVDIPGSDQKGRILGYLDADDKFHRLFELNVAQDLNKEGGIGFGRLPIQEKLPAFRWAIDPRFSSQPDDNPDQADHMVTWLVTDGESKGNYVFAWEDFDDRDFNDLVIEADNVAPLKQTPVLSSPAERDLLGLRGTLDDLCGLENLSRISDSDDQYWENRDAGTATARARHSGDPSETFEYIDRNNERQTIFTEVGDGTDVSSSGALPSAQELPVFRWGLESQFSSKPSDNADGADHMVTWEIIGGPCTNGNFLTAWEDRNISASDQDYQDIIVEVSGVEPLPQINDRVILHRDQIKTEYFPSNEPRSEYIGLFRITATFTNISDSVITKPFFAVVALSGTNRLVNADGGDGPRGSTDSVVGKTLSLNIEWAPGASETVTFDIGLRSRERFSYFVDLFEGERKR